MITKQLKEIIFGAEITKVKDNYILNKYNSKYEIIDSNLFTVLRSMRIIEFSSGSFETDEICAENHFSLNSDFLLFENGKTIIKINEIYKAILMYNTKFISLSKNSYCYQVQIHFEDLRKRLLRIEKLKRVTKNIEKYDYIN